MEYDPSGPFITSVFELKLDATTSFELQKHTQSRMEVPHYRELLTFIDLRAQASESSTTVTTKKIESESIPFKKAPATGRSVASFPSNHNTVSGHCICCQNEKHPLYICSKFKHLSHGQKVPLLKDNNNLCRNCLSVIILSNNANLCINAGSAKSHTIPCFTWISKLAIMWLKLQFPHTPL